MTPPSDPVPFGTHPLSGVTHRRTPLSVAETVDRLTDAIDKAGAKVFIVIDQRREAERAGLSLRDTTLLVFGSPAAGTPVMLAAPLAALDMPLKVLVWADDHQQVWMSYLSPEWLADRYGLSPPLAKPLFAVDSLTNRVASST
jgi:uncharacterized protein (DUF302 family)